MEEIKAEPPVSSAAEEQIRLTCFSVLPSQVPFKLISSLLLCITFLNMAFSYTFFVMLQPDEERLQEMQQPHFLSV